MILIKLNFKSLKFKKETFHENLGLGNDGHWPLASSYSSLPLKVDDRDFPKGRKLL